MASLCGNQRLIGLAIAAVTAAWSLPAAAQTIWQWNGTANTIASNTSNWTSGTVPGFGTTLNGRISVYNSRTASALSYTADQGTTVLQPTSGRALVIGSGSAVPGSMVITGGTLQLAGGGAVSDSSSNLVGSNGGSGSLTVDGGTFLAGPQKLSFGYSVTTSTATLTVNSGSANIPLLAFVSRAIINANGGALAISSAVGLATGTFNLNGGTIVSNTSTASFLQGFGGANVRDGGAVFNTAGFSVTVAQNLQHSVIAGDLAVDGGLRKLGTGSLTLSGSNSYTGGTQVNGGVLTLGNADAVGTAGTISFGGGTLQFSASNTTDYSGRFSTAADQVFSLDTNGQNVALATGITSANASLVKSGAGVLTLSTSNAFTGGAQLNGGSLSLGHSAALGSTGTISFGGGALQFSGSNTADYSSRFSTAAGQAYRLDTNGQNVTLATALASEGGSLTKSGAGGLTLSASNSYAGGIQVNGGAIVLSHAGALGSTGTISFSGGALRFTASNTTDYSSRFSTASGQAYSVDTNGQNVTLAAALTSSGGTLTKSGEGTLTLGGANTFSGATTITGGTLVVGNGSTAGYLTGSIVNNAALVINRSNATTYSGQISGTGSLTKLGAGTLTLSGSLSTFSGITSLGGGQVRLGNALALQKSTLDTSSGAAGTLSFGTLSSATIGGLTGSNGLVLANASNQAVALSVGSNNASTTFAGGLSGAGSLIKQGSGVLTLTGSSSHAGGTQVDAGSLLVNGAVGAVTVNGGGLLGGSGSALGAVAILAGGTFSPGNSPGLFTASSLSLAGTTLMEIWGATRGTGYDATDVTGALTYGGAMTLDFDSASFAEQTTFNLFDFGSFAGSFDSIVTTGSIYGGLTFGGEGDVRTATASNGQTLQFTYSTGELVIIVPEPGAIALAGLGMVVAGCVASRSRRRRP